MTLQRITHVGNAPGTTLASSINSSVTSFTVGTGTGTAYPSGSGGPFYIKIDAGQVAEEKILCASRSGDVFTVATSGRGADGTSAAAHSSGATVEHDFTAAEADDANAHIYTTSRDDHTQYLLSGGGRTNTGLTGATAASRWVGATAAGAPTAGPFAVGDFVIDRTGAIWICTTAGTPGTWNQVGGAGSTNATEIQGNPVAAGTPSVGEGYVWNGTEFALEGGGSSASYVVNQQTPIGVLTTVLTGPTGDSIVTVGGYVNINTNNYVTLEVTTSDDEGSVLMYGTLVSGPTGAQVFCNGSNTVPAFENPYYLLPMTVRTNGATPLFKMATSANPGQVFLTAWMQTIETGT